MTTKFWDREDDGDVPVESYSVCPGCNHRVFPESMDHGYMVWCEDCYVGPESPSGWGPTERDAVEAFEDAVSDLTDVGCAGGAS